MTTKSSPIQELKAQADKIAAMIKQSGKDTLKVCVIMDDKTIALDVTNAQDLPERDLARSILDLMQEV